MSIIMGLIIVAAIAALAYFGFLYFQKYLKKETPTTQSPTTEPPETEPPQTEPPQSQSQSSPQQSSPQQSQPQAQTPASPPKNVCDRGPQSKLNNKTCKEISEMKMPSVFGGEQTIYMTKNNINSNELGYKYIGEDCWYEPLGNCIVPSCINENSKVDKNLITCSIKHKVAKNGMVVANDPWIIRQIQNYNIKSLS